MKPREAIDQAKDVLVNDRHLTTLLNQTQTVRVPVMPNMSKITAPSDKPLQVENCYFVTFTIEETHFGLRLMADFKGHKEFAG